MVSVSDVKKLNAKIEKINKEKTRAEAQREMLSERLEQELESFKKQYGIDLKGTSFEETKRLVQQEVEKVSKQVEDEYNLKSKVVSAVESEDYELAKKLLGIPVETSASQAVTVASEVDSSDGLLDDTEELDSLLESLEDSDEESNEEINNDAESGEEPSDINNEDDDEEIIPDLSGINLDIGDDDDFGFEDEDFGFGNALSGSQFLNV